MSSKKGNKTGKSHKNSKKGRKSNKKDEDKGRAKVVKSNKVPESDGGKNKIALQKMLVGHYIENIPADSKKKVVYIWQGDGVWEVRKLRLGTFTSRIHEFDTIGLESNLKEGWVLNVPKIPASLLDVTLSFFRKIYDKHSSEVFLQFFYDENKEEYLVHCPKQQVSGASVKYDRDEKFETPEKILVFEIHSHASMPAFFSGTDDADEKDDRFFGVIGKVKEFYPEMKLRLSVGGRRREIDIGDIFDLDESSYNEESFPKDWVKRIQKQKKEPKRVRTCRRGPPYRKYYGRPPGSIYDPRSRTHFPVPTVDDPDYPGGGGFPPHSAISGRSGGCIMAESTPHQTEMFDKELRSVEPYSEEHESSFPVWPYAGDDPEMKRLADRLGLHDQKSIERLMENLGTDSVEDVNHYLDQVVAHLDSESDAPDGDYQEELLAYLGLTGEEVWETTNPEEEKDDIESKYVQLGDKYFYVTREYGRTVYRELKEEEVPEDDPDPDCELCDDSGWLREGVVLCSCETGQYIKRQRADKEKREFGGKTYASMLIHKQDLTSEQITNFANSLSKLETGCSGVVGHLDLPSERWNVRVYDEVITADTYDYNGEIEVFLEKLSMPMEKIGIYICPNVSVEMKDEAEEEREADGEEDSEDPREAIIRDWRGVKW